MGVLSRVQVLLAQEGRSTLTALALELEVDPESVERALRHLESTGRARRMTVRGSDPGSDVACGKNCSCSGGPAGPEFTVWVSLPLPR